VTPGDWLAVAAIGGWLIFVMLVIVWSLLRRPPNPLIRRLRLGVFVERDRDKPPEESPWPEGENTKELPPR
jgi:hypothetical protein